MTALLILAAIPIIMWLVQSTLLVANGLPVRWRLDSREAPPIVRTAGRITTQFCLLGVVVLYPLTQDQGVIEYYTTLLPRSRTSLQFVQGFAASTLFLCLLFGAWLATERLEIDVHHSRKKWIRRLVMLVPTTVFGAMVEELIFRGVVLADLLKTPWIPSWLAVAIGVVVFAGAHYVRTVKRRWTFPGHLMLGLLLCIAFVETRTLWLPMGLHAGGIFMIMGLRPFVRYRGPAWITGASIFPFAGVVGIAGLVVLTGFVIRQYGVP